MNDWLQITKMFTKIANDFSSGVSNASFENDCHGDGAARWNKTNVPAVDRVIFNENATIVYFEDGSKCVVRKSANDVYNREHAVVYAIVKRAYGTVNPETGVVEGNGMGNMLSRLVENAIVQNSPERKDHIFVECFSTGGSRRKRGSENETVRPWEKSSANEEADKVNSPNCRNCKFPTCSECLGAKDYRSSATWSDNSKWDWNKVQNRDSKGRFAKKSNRA